MLLRIFRLSELTRVTGLRRSALYAKIAKGSFPRPIPLGERAVGWLESDIETWQQQRKALRDLEVAPTSVKPEEQFTERSASMEQRPFRSGVPGNLGKRGS